MFYSKYVISFFIVSLLFLVGSPAVADEFEIEQEDLVSDSLLSYVRSFPVTSTVSPASYMNRTSVIVPEMTWPTDIKEISSDYGYRKQSCKRCSADHRGIDFTPGSGEPVYASLDGIVSRVSDGGGFGVHVYVDHIVMINTETQYWRTVYAHLKINSVPQNIMVGNIVEAGTILGLVGNTGTSTGPHLHFEVIVNEENVDPEKYLLMYAN
jgi:murein DD-endopeptidase MepM/ murein hydrolase activator NlpD